MVSVRWVGDWVRVNFGVMGMFLSGLVDIRPDPDCLEQIEKNEK